MVEVPPPHGKPPPADYVHSAERVASKGIDVIAAPQSGWLLAFVALVIATMVSDAYRDNMYLERMVGQIISMREYLSKIEATRAEEVRRCQEDMTDLVGILNRMQAGGGMSRATELPDL